jgi:hypothetical protein
VAAQRMPVERLAVRRLLARLHVVAALRVQWVQRAPQVVGAAQHCRVVRICRVARLHVVAALRVLWVQRAPRVVGAVPRYRVDHAADCCHVARTCRVHQPDWCRMLSVVVAGSVARPALG